MEPRKPVLRSYTESEPGPGEVRVRVKYGAPKHGSEMQAFQGIDPFLSSRLDPEMLLFLDNDTAKSKPFYLELGNICVGVVSDLGQGVTDVKEGQRVAIYRHLRETHVQAWSKLRMKESAAERKGSAQVKFSVCIDAVFAGRPFLPSLASLPEAGYDAFEFWSWQNKDMDGIRSMAARLGLTPVIIGTSFGNLVEPETRNEFLTGIRDTIQQRNSSAAAAS
ncbi:hypothetical protein [Paenibacillus sp.]|uniref:hypothetical protein n=1 Tax=Paenibacillus sp. TaxID=58172 RepID=UPI002D4B644B|nr:hypothetical protein [Paenibacillus sp.]HZG55609.1 hypothetical protein [Paenibacillus sp.]